MSSYWRRDITVALVTAIAVFGAHVAYSRFLGCKSKSNKTIRQSTYAQLIGNTPLIRLHRLSQILGVNIYVKMESLNPGGTGKDRAALYMLEAAKKHKNFHPGCDMVEGTSGSTGIALASLCNSLGYKLHIVMPDDQAMEKRKLLDVLGASVTVVPNCSISNSNHYVNQARRLADELKGIFIDQFENTANFDAHYETTGPEIFNQTEGRVDAFVMSAGTGGTIAGVSKYLKEKKPQVKVYLSDPQGSSLHRRVKFGVCYTPEQAERQLRKHRYDSIVEGVGLDRVTANFSEASIDDSFKISDQEIVNMAHWLLKEEGLFVGSSTALNIVGAVLAAKDLGPGKTVVTVCCDSGQRHLSRLWNKDYVSNYDISWPEEGVIPDCIKRWTNS